MTVVPEQLYHYTSQSGFLGVLESDQIWATKIQYLNDVNELNLAIEHSSELLKRKRESGGRSVRSRFIALEEGLSTISKVNICVASFTEEPDLLSQWRAYSGGLGGYSIGFFGAALSSAGKEFGFNLLKCNYDAQDRMGALSLVIDEFLSEYLKRTDDWGEGSSGRNMPSAAVREFQRRIMTMAPVFKDSAFSEEKEWRLVSKDPISMGGFDYRPGNSSLIPFFRIPLGSKQDYLGNVTVGPSPNSGLAIDATLNYLVKNGAGASWSLGQSKVPYRNW